MNELASGRQSGVKKPGETRQFRQTSARWGLPLSVWRRYQSGWRRSFGTPR